MIDALEELNQLNNTLSEGISESEQASTHRLTEAIDHLHLLYRAVRAYYAGVSYCDNCKFDYANTLCLFASQIMEELNLNETPSIFDSAEEQFVPLTYASDLTKEVELLSCRIKAEALLANTVPTPTTEAQTFISENLNTVVHQSKNGRYRVIPIPVPMKSTTCKPLFFDIFDDRLVYPNLDSRSKQPDKKGWFSGWWFIVCLTNCLLSNYTFVVFPLAFSLFAPLTPPTAFLFLETLTKR